MKIHVIFTGGTIGSCVKDGFVSTDDSAKYTLLSHFASEMEDVVFSTSEPYTILSENLSANELNLLQAEVAKAMLGDFDGIIVTHGTDTLQYTGCAIEYAFAQSKVPIILVSAAFPLEDVRTNGFENFRGAVEFIKNGMSGGVFVSYKNEASKTTDIHLPSRLLQHGESSADLFSINGEKVAEYDGKGIKSLFIPEKALSNGITAFCEYPGILVIEQRPADSYSYSLERVNAVILKPYHSATLDTNNKMLKKFCLDAKEKGIPVFVVDISDGASYESTKLFDSLGLIRCNGTYISTYMRLWAKISRCETLGE